MRHIRDNENNIGHRPNTYKGDYYMRRILALLLICVLVFSTGCSKKSDALPDYREGDTVDYHTDEDIEVDTKYDVTVDVDAELPEVLTSYPTEDAKSYYMQFVTEAPAGVFCAYDEDDESYLEYYGKPYALEGTVVKVFDEYVEYAKLYDVDGETLNYQGLNMTAEDMESTVLILRVNGTDVVVLNCLPDYTGIVKEYYKDDLITLKTYKTMYDNLATYEDFPTEGENVRIYGYYAGFGTRMEMPVFTYGIRRIIENYTFGLDYNSFRTDDKKSLRYKNYVDFEAPKLWSDVMESADAHYYFFEGGQITWDYYNDEIGLHDFVDMFYGGWEGDPNLTYTSQEYTTLSDGTTECHRVKYTYLQNGYSSYHEIVMFRHKGKTLILRFDDFDNVTDDELMIQDFDELVKSIKLRSA